MKVGRGSIVVAFLIIIGSVSMVNTVFPTAKAATLYVGGGGMGNYTTIQDAINKSSPSDTIYVYAGLYTENIVINETINLVGSDKDTTIIDGGGIGDTVNITVDSASITGFTIRNSGQTWGDAGIDMSSVDDCYIGDNIITNNYHGIFLFIAGDNTIEDNTIDTNTADGILLRFSHVNTFTYNEIQENGDGIQLVSSDGNTIANNTLHLNDENGISLDYSGSNIIKNNTLLYNGDGIFLDFSGLNTIHNNYLLNHNDGIQLFNSSSNTISGNSVVNSRYGYYIEFSTNNQVIDNNALYSYDGIRITNANDITITGNTALGSDDDGIQLSSSLNSTIADNILSSNLDDGLYLESAENNLITDNNAFENGDEGIELLYSKYNLIVNNTIQRNNEYGVHLSASTQNEIYHNNFINNGEQAYDDTGANHWNDTYLIGGNYWTDYLGADVKSGANQDLYGSDGIGDDPYDVQGGTSQDHYPLMGPYWPPTVTDPNQPPTCSISSPESGATISGIYTIGGTVYDPDGMIERVEIRIDDGEWIRVVGITSWSYNLNTTSLSDGEHTIYVRSYDGTNYSGEVSRDMVVDNSVPESSILEDGWLWAVIILVIIVVLLLILFFMKGRSEIPSESKEAEELKETKETEESKEEATEKKESESKD